MTIVFSGGTDKFLVMANDSAVVNHFADGKVEYKTGRKCFVLDGIGVVTMWGARVGNKLIEHLESSAIKPTLHDVEDLAKSVHRYLVENYAPHAGEIDDTGYHVGGFTAAGEVRLYHIYWNVARQGEHWGTYRLELHHIPRRSIGFLYNGRHDIASRLMQSLIVEMQQDNRTRFPTTPSGICRLAHFILRASSEISKEVEPPFFVHVLSPNRRCLTIPVDSKTPSDEAVFAPALREASL